MGKRPQRKLSYFPYTEAEKSLKSRLLHSNMRNFLMRLLHRDVEFDFSGKRTGKLQKNMNLSMILFL